METYKKFPLSELLELVGATVGAPVQTPSGEYKVVLDTITDKRRWVDVHMIVFSYGGEYYTATYQLPSTELQEQDDSETFGSANDFLMCKKVVPVLKQIVVYEEAYG